MKRILASLHNNNYKELLERFCEEERYTLTLVNKLEDVDTKLFILFITDKQELAKALIHDKTPVCIISDDKPLNNGIFYLKTTFAVPHLRLLTDNIYHGSLTNNYVPAVHPKIFIKEYVIDNDYYDIDRMACAMTFELALYFTFSDLEKIRIGLSEMITNAIEHGNLGITNKEKMTTTEEGTFYELIDNKLKDEKFSKLKTNVRIEFDNGDLTVIVTDQGKGFDTTKIPDPTDTDKLLKLHGRGILITRMYFDSIDYNDKGNIVTLRKTSKSAF